MEIQKDNKIIWTHSHEKQFLFWHEAEFIMIYQVWLLCIQSYIQVQLKASIQPNFVEVQNKFFSLEKNTKKKKGVEGEFIRISCFLSYFLSVILSLISSWKQRNGKI